MFKFHVPFIESDLQPNFEIITLNYLSYKSETGAQMNILQNCYINCAKKSFHLMIKVKVYWAS